MLHVLMIRYQFYEQSVIQDSETHPEKVSLDKDVLSCMVMEDSIPKAGFMLLTMTLIAYKGPMLL